MKTLFLWSIKDLQYVIEGCINNNYDCIMFIEGARGNGKSTLAYKLCSRLKLPIQFNPQRDIVYNRTDTLRHLATKKKGIIFSDEMVNVAYNRDFYQEEQKLLLKGLNMYRDSCNLFIGCIPSFIDLDKQIQSLCKIRITVIKRGIALIHTQVKTMYQSDKWDIKNNQKIESKWSLQKKGKPKYTQLTTVRGLLKYNDITPQQRQEYNKIKEEKRGRVFSNYTDDTLIMDQDQLFYKNLLEEIKSGRITRETFISIGKINNKTSRSMKAKINRLLAEEGTDKRYRDYVFSAKIKEKKEKQNLKIGYGTTTTIPLPEEDQKEYDEDEKD